MLANTSHRYMSTNKKIILANLEFFVYMIWISAFCMCFWFLFLEFHFSVLQEYFWVTYKKPLSEYLTFSMTSWKRFWIPFWSHYWMAFWSYFWMAFWGHFWMTFWCHFGWLFWVILDGFLESFWMTFWSRFWMAF